MKKRTKPEQKDNFDPDVDEEDEVYVVEEEEEPDEFVNNEEDAAFVDEDEVVEDDDDFVQDEDVPVPKNAKKSFTAKRKPRSQTGSSVAEEEEDELFPLGDFSNMVLLPDHERRPLWITDDGHLFLEMFHAAKVYDFIITIAEPIFRPLLMHE